MSRRFWVCLALTIPAALIAFFASQSILDGQHISIAFSHPGVPRAVNRFVRLRTTKLM